MATITTTTTNIHQTTSSEQHKFSVDPVFVLSENLCSTFNISKPIENDTRRPHPKFAHYLGKYSNNAVTGGEEPVKKLQEKRRQEFLENLKRKRRNILFNLRPLVELISENVDNDTVSEECLPMDQSIELLPHNTTVPCTTTEKNIKDVSMQVETRSSCKLHNKKPRNKWHLKKDVKDVRKLLSKQLMLSEWLVDVPANFYTQWYMMCCPQGKRALIIAAHGHTRVYSRTGHFMFEFQSFLPGGGRIRSMHSNMAKYSILDCVYIEQEHTFYVLDVIAWNGCTFFDCETEFRFFWLHSRFEEELVNANSTTVNKPCTNNTDDVVMNEEPSGEVHQVSANTADVFDQFSVNKLFSFVPLNYYPCTEDNIRAYAKGPYQFTVQMDGILFYHKRAPYTPGITPLVCWLKLHMIPTILNINLSQT